MRVRDEKRELCVITTTSGSRSHRNHYNNKLEIDFFLFIAAQFRGFLLLLCVLINKYILK